MFSLSNAVNHVEILVNSTRLSAAHSNSNLFLLTRYEWTPDIQIPEQKNNTLDKFRCVNVQCHTVM